MHRLIIYILSSLLIVMIAACKIRPITAEGVRGGTDNLDELKALTWEPKASKRQQMGVIRMQGLQDIALSLGARAGLAYRAKQINATMTQDEKNLSRIFNFAGLVMDHNVLPPVLEEASTTLNLDSKEALRISDRSYRIVEQARFVTTPPTWRDYLWMDFEKPEIPNRTLLPRDANEKKIWEEYVATGFDNGIAQANAIYAENVERLRRDYQGMVIYRRLLAQNMVSKPYVAKTSLGITGDSDKMRINDQLLRITALPSLNLDSKNWQAVIAR